MVWDNSLIVYVQLFYTFILHFSNFIIFGLFENSRKKVKKNVYGETSPTTTTTTMISTSVHQHYYHYHSLMEAELLCIYAPTHYAYPTIIISHNNIAYIRTLYFNIFI